MRQTAPVTRAAAPLTTARTVADASGSRSATVTPIKTPAGNQPWFGRDDCHCDDGPERNAKRAVSGRW